MGLLRDEGVRARVRGDAFAAYSGGGPRSDQTLAGWGVSLGPSARTRDTIRPMEPEPGWSCR